MPTNHAWRYERKYPLANTPKAEAMLALQGLKQRFGMREIYQPRLINNIYFDNAQLAAYFDNEEGAYAKQKIRIRWYGSAEGEITEARLEIKRKEGVLGRKEIHALPDFVLPKMRVHAYFKQFFAQSDLPALLNEQLKFVQPVLLNTYQRQYFEVANGTARITIDHKLSFSKVGNLTHLGLQRWVCPQDTIIELKYAQEKAQEVEKMMAKIPFTLGKYSKYANGMALVLFH